MVELVDLDQQAVGATDDELAAQPSSVVGLSDLDAGDLEVLLEQGEGSRRFKVEFDLAIPWLRVRRVRKRLS